MSLEARNDARLCTNRRGDSMKLWLSAVCVCALTSGTWSHVQACGDKFLTPSRGTRFDLSPAARERAAILLYANPASGLPASLTKLSVDPLLKKAGYRPTVVQSPTELERVLGQTAWDVLLIDLNDSSDVASRLPAAKAPAVIPVAFGATNAQLSRAKKTYGDVLKSPTRSQSFLDAIDDAVAKRRK